MRVIAKLDVKPPNVVKPVHFEGLRKVGLPAELAKSYYLQGADEILYIDIVASLYQRNLIIEDIEQAANEIFVPFGVGGGVKSIDDFSKLFHHGADKVVLNTYALQENPQIIDEAAKIFGSQAVVINIEAKSLGGDWNCYSDCGRIPSNKNVLPWLKEVEDRGAGEVIIQSVDTDGRQRGFDTDLINAAASQANIPVIAASGAGSLEDIVHIATQASPSAIAISSVLHYQKMTITDIKQELLKNNIKVTL